MQTATGLDMIGNNKPLQEHWVARLIAAIIDGLIIYGIFWTLFTMMAWLWLPFFGLWYISSSLPGVFMLLYAGVMEGTSGATIGKKLMKLQVMSLMGPLTMQKALMRNITKVHGLLLLVDWLAGLATEGDPRQRYLDRIAQTTVVSQGHMSQPLHHQPPPPGQYPPPPDQYPPPPPQGYDQPGQYQPPPSPP